MYPHPALSFPEQSVFPESVLEVVISEERVHPAKVCKVTWLFVLSLKSTLVLITVTNASILLYTLNQAVIS